MTYESYLQAESRAALNERVKRIIEDCVKKITIPALKNAARESLWKFFKSQQQKLYDGLPWETLLTVWAFLKLRSKRTAPTLTPVWFTRTAAISQLQAAGYDRSKLYGVPLKIYQEEYAKKRVAPVIDRLMRDYAKDPGDLSGRNSLRNRAEMEVRYDDHLRQIEEFRKSGAKLVIASAHADCSDRCRPWQGRVYSLDGTSGTAPDGRKYVPLEKATDIYYRTKAGKVYKNGLLGFNCRHYLTSYENGKRFPMISPKEQEQEYKITKTQRAMERHVREWTIRSIYAKGTSREAYLAAKERAKKWNDLYIAYSRKNGRAYYPSRTKII